MLWLNFIHLYQPANADEKIIREAAEKSYCFILDALEKNPGARWTINIAGCLLLRLEEAGYLGLIGRFKKLVEGGQVELTGSAAYHPILPLIRKGEAIKQIKENEKILKRYFGDAVKLRGFFFPEMACDPASLKLIKKLGYEWTIIDEIGVDGRLDSTDTSKVYEDAASGLKIIFRSRKLSLSYVPDALHVLAGDSNTASSKIITATDGELYGLRHIDNTGALNSLLSEPAITANTISSFIDGAEALAKTNPLPSSWESSESDLSAGQPFALWRGKANEIHQNLWKLAGLAEKTMKKFQNDANSVWARWHFVRGLASCTFWWASGRDFTHVFGPVSWNPDEIERGLNDMARSIRAINDPASIPAKLRAEKLQAKTRELVWKEHWTKYF